MVDRVRKQCKSIDEIQREITVNDVVEMEEIERNLAEISAGNLRERQTRSLLRFTGRFVSSGALFFLFIILLGCVVFHYDLFSIWFIFFGAVLFGDKVIRGIDLFRSLPHVRNVARLPSMTLRGLLLFHGHKIDMRFPEFQVIRVNGQFLHLSSALYNLLAPYSQVDISALSERLRELHRLDEAIKGEKLN